MRLDAFYSSTLITRMLATTLQTCVSLLQRPSRDRR